MWGVYPTEIGMSHVIPEDDLHEHSTEEGLDICGCWESKCACNPDKKVLDLDLRTWLFVHNSYDGREAVEWANQVLTQQH